MSPGVKFFDDWIAEINEDEAREQAQRAHDLTPSEVALARVLAAVTSFERSAADSRTPEALEAIEAVIDVLDARRFVVDTTPTNAGGELLDRARKAGVV